MKLMYETHVKNSLKNSSEKLMCEKYSLVYSSLKGYSILERRSKYFVLYGYTYGFIRGT